MNQLEKILSPYTKLILELLSILIAGSLVFGFLIVNLYLSQLGAWDFDFLKVEYISAGLLFFIFLGFAIFLVVMRERFIYFISGHAFIDKSGWKKMEVIVLRIITYLLMILLNGFLFFIPVEAKSISGFFIACYSMALWGIASHLLVLAGKNSYNRIMTFKNHVGNFNTTLSTWEGLGKLVYSPIAAIAVIAIFSVYVYPLIPRSWGGGRPINVKIYFVQNAPYASSMPAQLISQSSESALVSFDGDTYTIKQDQITDIEYLDKKPEFIDWLNSANQ